MGITVSDSKQPPPVAEERIEATFREVRRKRWAILVLWVFLFAIACLITFIGYLVTHIGDVEQSLAGLQTYWNDRSTLRNEAHTQLLDIAGIAVALLALSSIVARPNPREAPERRAQMLLLQQTTLVGCGALSLGGWLLLPISFQDPLNDGSASIPWGTGDFVFCLLSSLLGSALFIAVGLGYEERLRQIIGHSRRLELVEEELLSFRTDPGENFKETPAGPVRRLLTWWVTVPIAVVAAAPLIVGVWRGDVPLLEVILYALLMILAVWRVLFTALEVRWGKPLRRYGRMNDRLFALVVYVTIIAGAGVALLSIAGRSVARTDGTDPLTIFAVTAIFSALGLAIAPRTFIRTCSGHHDRMHLEFLRREEQLARAGLAALEPHREDLASAFGIPLDADADADAGTDADADSDADAETDADADADADATRASASKRTLVELLCRRSR